MKKLIILIIIVFTANAFATIINIPDDYPTIQAGIDSSTNGDTVLVQPGTCVENINFNGHNIVLGSLFLTTGDTSYIGQTVIDGDSAGTVVKFENGEDSTTIIAGFTIQNGYSFYGGGIYCAQSNPKIINNCICFNRAGIGGGIYCNDSDPFISNNHIFGNVSDSDGPISHGGGIGCIDSSPLITRNFISNNYVYELVGGGIYCAGYSFPIITNNLIEGNHASDGGGLACLVDVSPTISSNLIINNTARELGGGIWFFMHCNVIMLNNTVTGNAADSVGGLYTYDSDLYIINNIIWGNGPGYDMVMYFDRATVLYNLLDRDWPGDGNFIADPLFRDPENGDFHLMATYCGDPYDSPCIDMGHPEILDSLLDCDWGLGELRSDMGAYGGRDSAAIAIDDFIALLPAQYRLMQNYPNPFNASTAIKYELPRQAQVTIEIYDILGRRVSTLQDGLQPAGYHQVVWNAGDLSTGVYFYKLQAGDCNETKKMMLIK